MDKTLSQYDESLEALERQRKRLQIVMQKMGEEWEESGAGIGWMRDSFYQTSASGISATTIIKTPSQQHNSLAKFIQQPSISRGEPSHDYLQTLLNVNDELLAQSLASVSHSTKTISNEEKIDVQDLMRTNNNNAFVSHLPISPPLIEQEPSSAEHPKRNRTPSTPPFTPEEKQS